MLSDRLKAIRKKRGYSQQQMAQKLHLTQGAISQWENGLTVPAADQLLSLAEVFGVSVDEILRDEQPEEKNAKKEAPTGEALDNKLIEMLTSLTPDQVQRVMDFVAGMQATGKV